MMNEKAIYNNVDAVKKLNMVEGFNPLEYMREISEEGKDKPKWYLDVKYRTLWFRLCNPYGKITTNIKQFSDKYAIVEAIIYLNYEDAIEKYVSKATSLKTYEDGKSFLEWAETAAIGRALTNAGYGIQFCDLVEENDIEITESGIEAEIVTGKKASEIQNNKPVAATPVSTPTAPPKMPMNYEDALKMLTVDECKKVKIDFGVNSGKSMGDIAINNPSAVEWIARQYSGRNFLAKAAANILLNEALKVAS